MTAPRPAHSPSGEEVRRGSSELLSVRGLVVEYHSNDRTVRALDQVDLMIRPGDRLGLVGESGSGKTTLGLALPQLLPNNAALTGSIVYDGQELIGAPQQRLRELRGAEIAVVFQDAGMSFNPVRTIGFQMVEAIREHESVSKRAARARAADLLAEVDVPKPRERLRQYPHELSGGQRQRAMIAMALSSAPRILIADEPTSALDVTTQAGVIELLTRLSEERNMATILITHDLGVVARFASDVTVLYGGKVMESATSEAAMLTPFHPYTADLVASVPQLAGERLNRLVFIPGRAPALDSAAVGCVYQPRCPIGDVLAECRTTVPMLLPVDGAEGTLAACHRAGEYSAPDLELALHVTTSPSLDDPVLVVEDIDKSFKLGRGGRVLAVGSVSFAIARSESFGVVGESGSGKTTLARVIVGLTQPDRGTVEYRPLDPAAHRRPQMIFQDPTDSLDPLMTIGEIITQPLVIQHGHSHNRYRPEAAELLEAVGLPTEFLRRHPRQLSGGQRQRVAIARALSTGPELILADEAVSALDMSAKGQILNLLADLRDERGIAYMHISHDLSMVRHICDRVAVMHAGEIVELAPVEDLFRSPQHPYTQLLLDSVPTADPLLERARRRPFDEAAPTDPTIAHTGCPFRWRCPRSQQICADANPPLLDVAEGHAAACHFPGLDGFVSPTARAVSHDD